MSAQRPYARECADWPCRPGWIFNEAPSWWWHNTEIPIVKITRGYSLYAIVRDRMVEIRSEGWEKTPEGLLAAQEWAERMAALIASLQPSCAYGGPQP